MERCTLLNKIESAGTLIADGATGSSLHDLYSESTGEYVLPHGCPDALSLSHPDIVRTLHMRYLDAGADIILTNTFGACPFTLEPFGLADRAEALNMSAARIARRAAEEFGSGLVIGSIGPGSLLPSLNQVSFRALMDAYVIQIRGLMAGGVEGLLVETCQDPLQAKAALAAIGSVSPGIDRELPIIVSFTVESTGAMLLGTSIDAMITTVLPYGPALLGINCGAGPETLAPFLEYFSSISPAPVWFKPNAGTPRMKDEKVVFPVDPEGFAQRIVRLLRNIPVAVVGGCCGTTAAHIREIRNRLPAETAPRRPRPWKPSLSSLYDRVFYEQEDSPLLIGERGNVNGSRKFRRIIEDRDFDAAVSLITKQSKSGAHAVDVCVDRAESGSGEDLRTIVRLLRGRCRMPVFLDSASPDTLIRAAEELPGRGVLNSVDFGEGEENFKRIAEACLRTGCAMVVLAVDKNGQALTTGHKISIADRAEELGRESGLNPYDIFFDPLTFPIGTGQTDLREAGSATLAAIEIISREHPRMPTILGVSNISHGLAPPVRRVLNSVMLQLAFQRGLNAAIIHPGQIEPLHTIDTVIRARAEDLLLHEAPAQALTSFLSLFDQGKISRKRKTAPPADPLENLKNRVIEGDADELDSQIANALAELPAEVILAGGILRGMDEVGELFKRGEMQIPFVLASAEVVRKASELIAPHLPVRSQTEKQSVVLATVEGDVHDIGKNLVGIILKNNGYAVHDLGIRVPVVKAFNTAVENGSTAIGLSGLLVQSIAVMRRGLEQIASSSPPHPPIIVGGAALNSGVVEKNLARVYPGPVFYAKDAMDGLEIIRNLGRETGTRARSHTLPVTKSSIKPSGPVKRYSAPEPPFTGSNVETDISLDTCMETLNRRSFYRRFWKLDEGTESDTLLEGFIKRFKKTGVSGAGIFGYYRAKRIDGSEIAITDPETGISVTINPGRQSGPPRRSLADYLNPEGDYVSLFVATMGNQGLRAAEEAKEAGDYRDYFLLHGLTMALTEALAERFRRTVMKMWGFKTKRGKAYAPGMPAFPDLSVHESFFALLNPSRIGVTHTETWSLIPECSASGLITHHPEATYFHVERSKNAPVD